MKDTGGRGDDIEESSGENSADEPFPGFARAYFGREWAFAQKLPREIGGRVSGPDGRKEKKCWDQVAGQASGEEFASEEAHIEPEV